MFSNSYTTMYHRKLFDVAILYTYNTCRPTYNIIINNNHDPFIQEVVSSTSASCSTVSTSGVTSSSSPFNSGSNAMSSES